MNKLSKLVQTAAMYCVDKLKDCMKKHQASLVADGNAVLLLVT